MSQKIDQIAELNKQLEDVKEVGLACAQQVKTTQKAEREYMVAVYLWWRTAHKESGYLEGLYQHNKLSYYKQKKGINFTPLIRLTTGDTLGKDFDSIWNRALNAIHEKFEKSGKRFKANTAEKLANLFDVSGGKTGLADKWKISKSDEKEADNFNEWTEFELVAEEFNRILEHTFENEARKYYQTNQSLRSLNIQSFQHDRDGYSTILVKHTPNGAVVVGSSAENVLINQSLIATYRSDFDVIPIRLRSLIETIHVLNTPNSATNDPNKFLETTKFDDHLNSEKKLKNRRRVVFSANEQCFLNSQIHSQSCLVIKSYPKMAPFDQVACDVHLVGNTQNWIETVLLRNRLFNIYGPQGTDKFTLSNIGDYKSYALLLQNKTLQDDEDAQLIQKHVKVFRNEEICWQPFFERKSRHSTQLTFDFLSHFSSDDDFSNFDWHSEFTIESLRMLANQFLEPWISEYAELHKRPMNATFELVLDNDIKIKYEKSESAQAHDIEYVFNIPNSKSVGNFRTYIRSIDFSFLLRQISDLNVISPIYIFAQKIGMILLFETSANSFLCFIPNCDLSGKRSENGFNYFKPETINKEAYYFPMDENFAPDEPDYSDIEGPNILNKDLESIISTINRLRGKN